MNLRDGFQFDWVFWFQWVMATTLGWVLGGILSTLGFLISGVGIGFFQWMILSGRISKPWRWALVTIPGWFIGWVLGIYLLPDDMNLLAGIILGLATGISQWLILRKVVNYSWWWIIFSVIGWVSGLYLLPGLLMTGIIAGIFTGICIILLLEQPLLQTSE